MDFFDRTGGYIERVNIIGRKTYPKPHSKEIKDKFPNFESLDMLWWDEADVWDCPMDLTLLPLKDMNLEELYQLHKSLLRINDKYNEREIPLHKEEHRQASHSLVLVEQWIYYREIVEPRKKRGAKRPENYYRSLAVQERKARKVRSRNGYDKNRYFGIFWNFFFEVN